MKSSFRKTTAFILAVAMTLLQNGVTTLADDSERKVFIQSDLYQEIVENDVSNEIVVDEVVENNITDSIDVDENYTDENIDDEVEPMTDDFDVVIGAVKYATETPKGCDVAYDENDKFKCYVVEETDKTTGTTCKKGYIAEYLGTYAGKYDDPVELPPECFLESDKVHGNAIDVVGIYDNAFYDTHVLKFIKLSDKTEEIKPGAFAYSSIIDVIDADTPALKSIGANAFKGSDLGSGLNDSNYYKISDTVTEIGVGAFRDCKSLKQVCLPDSSVDLKVARAYSGPEDKASASAETFAGCTSLVRVNYKSGTSITVLPAHTFDGCVNLKKISLDTDKTATPGVLFDLGVEYIGDRCFYDCQMIPTFEASVSLKYIGVEAFATGTSGVSALKTVKFGGVETIGKQAFKGAPLETSSSSTGKLEIPGTIKNIGYEAFSGCKNLGTVIFESSTSVSENTLTFECNSGYSRAFEGCTSLKNVTLPNHLEMIPSRLFKDCTSLAVCKYDGYSDKVKDNGSKLKEIGSEAFRGCIALKELEAPTALEKIGESAYEGCKALTWVDLEYSTDLKVIGKRAFAESAIGQNRPSRYSTIYISKNMTEIGQEAFLNCSGITEVAINGDKRNPDISQYNEKLTIGQSAFEGCTNLQQVMVGRIADNMYKSSSGSITCTNPVTKINEYAIGNKAFYNCENLKGFYSVVYDYGTEGRIKDPNNKVNEYYNGDLAVDYADDQVTAKDTVDNDGFGKSALFTIGDSAFEGCKELMYAPLVASPALREIRKQAFNNCINLELFEEAAAREAYCPDGYEYGTFNDGGYDSNHVFEAGAPCSAVRRIGSTNLEAIGYKAFNNTAIGKVDISDVDKDKEVRRLKIYGNPIIEYNAFSNTSALAYLDIIGAPTFKEVASDNNESKGSTFEKARELKEVVFRDLKEGTTELCSYMFADCAKLERVYWPSSLKQIGESCFYGCVKLQDFNKDENLINIERIEDKAFSGCTSLEEVYFTDCNKLMSIGSYAFYKTACGSSKNMGNKKIIIPCTVAAIGKYAFSECRYLEEVFFDNMADGITPAETIVLGEGCFMKCPKLITLYLPTRCVSVPEKFMYNSPSILGIYVPISVTRFAKDVVSAEAIRKNCTIYGDAAVCVAADFAKKNSLKYSYNLSVLPIFAQQIAISVSLSSDDPDYPDAHLGTYYVHLQDNIAPDGDTATISYEGRKIVLKSKVLPQTVENKDVVYYSSNDNVVIINNDGVGTINGYGTTRLYAISKSKSAVASCVTLTVLSDFDRKDEYTKQVETTCSDLTSIVRNVCPTTDSYSLDKLKSLASELGNDVNVRWTETYPIIGDEVRRNAVSYDGERKEYTVTFETEQYGDIETEPIDIKAYTITGCYLWPASYENTETEKYVENNTMQVGQTLYYDVYVTTTEHKYDPKARFGGGIKLSDTLTFDRQYVLLIDNYRQKQVIASEYAKRRGVVCVSAISPGKGAKIGVSVLFKNQGKNLVYDKKTVGINWVSCDSSFNVINEPVVNSIDIEAVPSPVGPYPLEFETVSNNGMVISKGQYSADNGELATAEVFKYIGSNNLPADAMYKIDAYTFINQYDEENKCIKKVPNQSDIVWTVNNTALATVKKVKGDVYLTIKKKAVGEFILTATATKNGGYARSVRIRVLDDTVLAPRLSAAEVTINQNYDQNAADDFTGLIDDKSGYQYAEVELSIPDYFKKLDLLPPDNLKIYNLRLSTKQGRGSNRYDLKQTQINADEVRKVTDNSLGTSADDKETYVVRIITKHGKIPSGTENLCIYGTYEWTDPQDSTKTYRYDFKTTSFAVKGVKVTPTITFTQEPADYVKLYSAGLGGNVLIRSSEEIEWLEYESSAQSGKPRLVGDRIYAKNVGNGGPMYEYLYHLQTVDDRDTNYKNTNLNGKFRFKFKKYSEYATVTKSFASKAAKTPNPIKVTADSLKLAPLTEADTTHVIITDAVTGARITEEGLYYKKTAKDGTEYYIKDKNSDDYTIEIGTYYKNCDKDPNFEINPPQTTLDEYKVDDYTVKAIGMTDKKTGGIIDVKVRGAWRSDVVCHSYVQVTTVQDESTLGMEKTAITLNANSDVKYNKNDNFNPSNEVNGVTTKVFVPGFEDDANAVKINPAEFKITGADILSKQQLDYGKIVAEVIWPKDYVEYSKTNDYRTYGVENIDMDYLDHTYANPVVKFSLKPGAYNATKQYSFKVSAKIDSPKNVDDGKEILLYNNLLIGVYANKVTTKDSVFEKIKFKELVSEEDIPGSRVDMVTSASGLINVMERANTYLTVNTSVRRTTQKVIDAHLSGGYANLFESKYDADKKLLYIRATKGHDIKGNLSYPMKVETMFENGSKGVVATTAVPVKTGSTTITTDKKGIRFFAGATGIESGTDIVFTPKNGRISVSPFYPEEAAVLDSTSLSQVDVVVDDETDAKIPVDVDDLGRVFAYLDVNGNLHGEVGYDEDNDGYVDNDSIFASDGSQGSPDTEGLVVPVYNPRKTTYTDVNYCVDKVSTTFSSYGKNFILIPYDGKEYYIADYTVVNPDNEYDTFTFKAGSEVKPDDANLPGYNNGDPSMYIASLPKYDPMDVDDSNFVYGRKGSMKYRIFLKPTANVKIGNSTLKLNVYLKDGPEGTPVNVVSLPITVFN